MHSVYESVQASSQLTGPFTRRAPHDPVSAHHARDHALGRRALPSALAGPATALDGA